MLGSCPNRWPFQQNHITEHQTGFQQAVLLYVPIAVLHLLFKRREEKIEAVALVELQQVRLVVGLVGKI
ncbi:MAG: hypothetical protein IJ197_08570 [Bacteroidaceae bacterium]|nr:hypothetical protein [Bacteroidaceae bacterium]